MSLHRSRISTALIEQSLPPQVLRDREAQRRAREANSARQTRKTPNLAGGLSLFVVGAGQLYLGQRWRAVALFTAWLAIGSSALLLFGPGALALALVFDLTLRLANAWDAYHLAGELPA